MNGLTMFLIFFAGWVLGVLTVLWDDSPDQEDRDIKRLRAQLDDWDGTR